MVPLTVLVRCAGRDPIARYQIRDMQEGGDSCKRRRIGEASNSNQTRTVAVIDGKREITRRIRRGP